MSKRDEDREAVAAEVRAGRNPFGLTALGRRRVSDLLFDLTGAGLVRLDPDAGYVWVGPAPQREEP